MLRPQHKARVYLFTLGIILIYFSGTCSSSQPPYQVSLFVSLHPRAPPIHYCNGVIVHSRLVLTTASCTYYQSSVIEADGMPALRIPVEKISVVPGIAGSYNVVNTFNVLDVNIAQGFNSSTLTNNLALLHLDTSLPLGRRDDIQWIILDGYGHEAEGLYMAAFPSLNEDPHYMMLENLRILPNEQCAQADVIAPIIRKEDICTRYPYANLVGPDCELPADFPAFNSDYGTGLIIRSHLVALFSHAIASANNQTTTNCHDQQHLKAIFTDVGPHLDWIYGIIAYAEALALTQNDFMNSAPYQQIGNSAIMHVSKAAESTSLAIGSTIATTLETTVTTTTKTATAMSSTTEVNSPQPLSVSRAHKATNLEFATLLNSLMLFLIFAYFKN
ncbi:uncharacterized protein LOC129247741 [Anastrepha obliqua]|uniref:uncharacterized protein LOC129247741 n=1 Tax=Anastrepha obliqua TaxID=95512 RepID=UPI0024098491|nr:uncharacterized protein LOC129247741 [Anastrepha obliqua]